MVSELYRETPQSDLQPVSVSTSPDIVSSTEDYAKRFACTSGEWMLSVQTQAIDDLLRDVGCGTILDVGGGHAQVTPHLMAQGREVTALVSCEEAAARLNRVSGGTAPYVLGSVEQLEQPDQSYDIVIAMRMMAHVADWELFLASACRVARKAVIVDFPLASGIHRLYPLLFGLKKAIETDTRTYSRLPHKAVATAFRDNGFDPDAHVGQFVVPMAFHRFIKNVPISRASEAIFSPFASRMGNPVIIRAQRLPK